MNHLLYIDSGGGSYIIQIIIATALGAGYYFKFYWGKVVFFFKKDVKSIDQCEQDKQ